MKIKTAYRRPKKPQAEEVAAAPIEPIELAAAAPAIPPEPKIEIAALDTAYEPALEPKIEKEAAPPPKEEESDITRALKMQIAETERSLELNRQYQAQAAQVAAAQQQQPLTREQLIEHWRHGGMSAANLEFLQRHPEMIDGWQLTVAAAGEASRLGHNLDTDEHRAATREIFHRFLGQAADDSLTVTATSEPDMQTPKFFTPPPRPRQPRQAIVSAPVSREGGYREQKTRVQLSPQEVEAARIAGISPAEYARQKVRVAEARARGELQGEQ
jgi:hypothetical protein